MAADERLAGLRADTHHRVPDPPSLDELIEDVGRQRLAAYYLYSASLAGGDRRRRPGARELAAGAG